MSKQEQVFGVRFLCQSLVSFFPFQTNFPVPEAVDDVACHDTYIILKIALEGSLNKQVRFALVFTRLKIFHLFALST